MNTLQTYTAEQLGELMHASPRLVRDWETAGLIKGIKSGKSTVYTTREILRFQAECIGKDISNLKRALEAQGETK